MKTFERLLPAIKCAVLAAMAAAFIIIPMSCAKGNHMGKLRGMWQITRIETPDPANPGGPDIEVAMDERRYISFDQWVVQLTRQDDISIPDFDFRLYAGKVDGEEPDFTLTFPECNSAAKLKELGKWGIDSNPVEMHVIKLDSKELVVRMGDNTLTMRRF